MPKKVRKKINSVSDFIIIQKNSLKGHYIFAYIFGISGGIIA